MLQYTSLILVGSASDSSMRSKPMAVPVDFGHNQFGAHLSKRTTEDWISDPSGTHQPWSRPLPETTQSQPLSQTPCQPLISHTSLLSGILSPPCGVGGGSTENALKVRNNPLILSLVPLQAWCTRRLLNPQIFSLI